jgi:hypothetical protein
MIGPFIKGERGRGRGKGKGTGEGEKGRRRGKERLQLLTRVPYPQFQIGREVKAKVKQRGSEIQREEKVEMGGVGVDNGQRTMDGGGGGYFSPSQGFFKFYKTAGA